MAWGTEERRCRGRVCVKHVAQPTKVTRDWRDKALSKERDGRLLCGMQEAKVRQNGPKSSNWYANAYQFMGSNLRPKHSRRHEKSVDYW